MTIIDKLVNEMSVDELRERVKIEILENGCINHWSCIEDQLPEGEYCDGGCMECWNREYKEIESIFCYYFKIIDSQLGDEIYSRVSLDVDIFTLDEEKQKMCIDDLKKRVVSFGGGVATLISEEEYLANTEED